MHTTLLNVIEREREMIFASLEYKEVPNWQIFTAAYIRDMHCNNYLISEDIKMCVSFYCNLCTLKGLEVNLDASD